MTLLSTLAREGSKLMGQKDLGCAGSLSGSFLMTTMSAFFQDSGKIPVSGNH